MKRLLAISLFTLTLGTAFGAVNDTLITFSTPGPDKYADGTTVKDGECYALVWTKTGAAFAGIAADGKAVGDGSEVMAYVPVAKGGRCPTVVFEIDADLAEAYKDGTYGIYLCDTRLANGKVGGLTAAGVPVAVNGYGAVKGEGEGEGLKRNSFDTVVNVQPSASALVSVTKKSELPADAPKPQITSIKVVGANVVLTVKGTLPCLQYAAEEVVVGSGSSGKEDGLSTAQNANSASQGAATVDEEITVIVPKKGDSGLFKIGRK